MWRLTVDAETKPASSDTESLTPNVKILSEQMKEVQQKLAEHLNAGATKREERTVIGHVGLTPQHPL